MTKHSQDRELASFFCLVFNKVGCTFLPSQNNSVILLFSQLYLPAMISY